MKSDVSCLLKAISVEFPRDAARTLIDVFLRTSLQSRRTWLRFIQPFFSKCCQVSLVTHLDPPAHLCSSPS